MFALNPALVDIFYMCLLVLMLMVVVRWINLKYWLL